MSRAYRYTTEVTPPCSTTSGTLLTAFRLADRYARNLPTVKQLCGEFGMSRATAYRWRSAMRIARGV